MNKSESVVDNAKARKVLRRNIAKKEKYIQNKKSYPTTAITARSYDTISLNERIDRIKDEIKYFKNYSNCLQNLSKQAKIGSDFINSYISAFRERCYNDYDLRSKIAQYLKMSTNNVELLNLKHKTGYEIILDDMSKYAQSLKTKEFSEFCQSLKKALIYQDENLGFVEPSYYPGYTREQGVAFFTSPSYFECLFPLDPVIKVDGIKAGDLDNLVLEHLTSRIDRLASDPITLRGLKHRIDWDKDVIKYIKVQQADIQVADFMENVVPKR